MAHAAAATLVFSRLGRDTDNSARFYQFLRIVDQPIGQGQTGLNLDAIAEIAAQSHRLEDHLVVGVERGDLHAVGAEDERGQRNRSVFGSAGMWK